jgi:hypothetical protein
VSGIVVGGVYPTILTSEVSSWDSKGYGDLYHALV